MACDQVASAIIEFDLKWRLDRIAAQEESLALLDGIF